MKILVAGAGAVGTYFGGRLAQAGHEVCWMVRSPSVERITQEGIQIDSIAGDVRLPPPSTVVVDPTGLDNIDLVLVGVKTWQVEDIGKALQGIQFSETGFVLPLLNGVDAPTQLGRFLGANRVVGGFCKILCHLVGPGHVAHTGVDPLIVFGELDGNPSDRCQRASDALSAAGIRTTISTNIRGELWEKLLFIAATGGVGALTRAPLGAVLSLPETRALLGATMQEIFDVARGLGIDIAADAIERTFALMDKLPADTIASMHRDIANSKPSELEGQTGAVIRYGRIAKVPTPVNHFIHTALLVWELRARGLIVWS